MPKDNWMKDIESDFDNALSKSKRVPRVRKKTRTTTKTSNFTDVLKDNSLNLSLFMLILLLSIGVIVSYNYRSHGSVFTSRNSDPQSKMWQNYHQDALKQQQNFWNTHQKNNNARQQQFETAAEKAIKQTWSKTRWNSERVTLLGILYNNNTAAARQGSRDFLYLNADWTIDRMPQFLSLDAEDRAFLQRFVKKKQ